MHNMVHAVKMHHRSYIVHIVQLVALNSKISFFIFLEPSKLVLFDKRCFFFYFRHKFLEYSNTSYQISKIYILLERGEMNL